MELTVPLESFGFVLVPYAPPPEPCSLAYGLSETQLGHMRRRLLAGRRPAIGEAAYLKALAEYDETHYPMCCATPVRYVRRAA